MGCSNRQHRHNGHIFGKKFVFYHILFGKTKHLNNSSVFTMFKMEQAQTKKIYFKAKQKNFGGSNYILIPAKATEFENITEDTIFDVTLEY